MFCFRALLVLPSISKVLQTRIYVHEVCAGSLKISYIDFLLLFFRPSQNSIFEVFKPCVWSKNMQKTSEGSKIDAKKLDDPTGSGLTSLEKHLEPTIIVIPDAILFCCFAQIVFHAQIDETIH